MRPSILIIQTPAPDAVRLQRGIGLVEVMVAALILSIGVLGFVAMQLKAVRLSSESYARVQAMAIAQDLVERITMNDTSLVQSIDGYAIKLSEHTSLSIPTTLPTNCQSGACTPAEMVTFDLGQIAYYASTLLPGGLVSGRIAASDSSNVQVFVSWGGTLPEIGTADDACMEESGGVLSPRTESNCVMLEATFQ